MLPIRYCVSAALLVVCAACGPTVVAHREAPPEHFGFRLHPENPHYFEYHGQPMVLVTSGEHYGALINLDFDYRRYFDELQSKGLNHTRVFAGTYREAPGDFGISNNTLAPKPERFIAPWQRRGYSNGRDGLPKFDLDSWNPAYFERLRDLLSEAEARGIIVELTLFCPYYNDSMWEISPFNIANNINGVGDVDREQALTMVSDALLEAQQNVALKTAVEVKDAPNVYFEICNEPYARNLVATDWQNAIAASIVEGDGLATTPHLISQNYANGSARVGMPHEAVSIYNFHYSRPPDSVGLNYSLNRAIGNNETGFDGSDDATYRIQGWDFLFAGGALYNNLDYSFAPGHESGDFDFDGASPGGGSATLRRQLGALNRFFHELPFLQMAPDEQLIASASGGVSARALSGSAAVYALYLHRGRVEPDARPRYAVDSTPATASVELNLRDGEYAASWFSPVAGENVSEFELDHPGGAARLTSPAFSEDLALVLRQSR